MKEPVLQVVPVKPELHAHLNEPMNDVQAPLTQGLDAQLSMTEAHVAPVYPVGQAQEKELIPL